MGRAPTATLCRYWVCWGLVDCGKLGGEMMAGETMNDVPDLEPLIETHLHVLVAQAVVHSHPSIAGRIDDSREALFEPHCRAMILLC